ncbi:MAG: endonuclease, partial [Deltaproteobacteria bacterium]|nr:endonuclease [Nannocystaceae bacterium]
MLSAGRFAWTSWGLLCGVLACGGTSATEASKDGKEAADAKAKAPVKPKPEAKAEPREVAPSQRALPTTPPTREEAAKRAAEIHADHRVSFYCGCSYTTDMRTIRQSCGYKTRADESLAHEIKWTHVVPARAFGAHRACWTTEACQRDDGTSFGGIECCRQRDPMFTRMENDLTNFVPEIAEVDKDRSDFPFGTIKGEVRMYGACDIEVDGAAEIVEPPEAVRGDVARVYLYMRAVYGDELQVPAEQWSLLEQWAADDPPDAWEQQRGARIAELQKLAAPDLGARPPPPPPPAGAAPAGGGGCTAR